MFEHLKNRNLYRSPKDALAFGVAAGLAHYFEIDVVFVRLLVVLLAFLSGWWPTLLLYIIAIFLIPVDPAQDSVASDQRPKDVTPEPGEKMDRGQNM